MRSKSCIATSTKRSFSSEQHHRHVFDNTIDLLIRQSIEICFDVLTKRIYHIDSSHTVRHFVGRHVCWQCMRSKAFVVIVIGRRQRCFLVTIQTRSTHASMLGNSIESHRQHVFIAIWSRCIVFTIDALFCLASDHFIVSIHAPIDVVLIVWRRILVRETCSASSIQCERKISNTEKKREKKNQFVCVFDCCRRECVRLRLSDHIRSKCIALTGTHINRNEVITTFCERRQSSPTTILCTHIYRGIWNSLRKLILS